MPVDVRLPRVGEAIEQAIVVVTGRLPEADIAGVGIATDADATSIVAFANSRENLDGMSAREPQFAIDSRWHLGEWDMDATQVGADDPLRPVRREMDRVKRLVTAAGDGRSGTRELDEFRTAVWTALSRTMAESVANGFFERWPNAVRVFLPLDADIAAERLAAWNAPLHTADDHAEFREFLQLDRP